MAGDLRVVGKAEVAVLHPPKQEGVVLGEFEGAGGAVGVLDLEGDGSHGESRKVKSLDVELERLGRYSHTH